MNFCYKIVWVDGDSLSATCFMGISPNKRGVEAPPPTDYVRIIEVLKSYCRNLQTVIQPVGAIHESPAFKGGYLFKDGRPNTTQSVAVAPTNHVQTTGASKKHLLLSPIVVSIKIDKNSVAMRNFHGYAIFFI